MLVASGYMVAKVTIYPDYFIYRILSNQPNTPFYIYNNHDSKDDNNSGHYSYYICNILSG